VKKRGKKIPSKKSSEGTSSPVLEGEIVSADEQDREDSVVVDSDDSDVIDVDFSVEDSEDAEHEIEEDAPRALPNPPKASERGVVPYNALDAYLAEIRRFTPLTKEEEHAVAVDFLETKDPQAAYTLVSSTLWLVVKIARDYERVAKNVLDLIQEGNMGLMEAVQNFDPYRGVRFPSYAVWWIRAYIIRYVIANWRMVKIGTTQAQRKLFFNLKKEADRLEREGIYPSTKLLAERLQVKEGEVVEMSQRLGGPDISFDAPVQEEGTSDLLSIMPVEASSTEDIVAKKQLQEALLSSIESFKSQLNEKEQATLVGRIVTDEKRTLQELSDELSISKERVRQIENKVRERLQKYLADEFGAELEDWIEE
jgi:RNA polymerase sigma-32 factor